jgi:hypothetical protein
MKNTIGLIIAAVALIAVFAIPRLKDARSAKKGCRSVRNLTEGWRWFRIRQEADWREEGRWFVF